MSGPPAERGFLARHWMSPAKPAIKDVWAIPLRGAHVPANMETGKQGDRKIALNFRGMNKHLIQPRIPSVDGNGSTRIAGGFVVLPQLLSLVEIASCDIASQYPSTCLINPAIFGPVITKIRS